MKLIGAALVLGICIIAAAFVGRYEIASEESAIFRIDRMTGRVEACLPYPENRADDVGAAQPTWCAAEYRVR